MSIDKQAQYKSKFSRLWERYDEACHGNAEHMRDILELTLDALETAERRIANSDRDVRALTEALDSAEKRIASLEPRTLTVKPPEEKDSPQGWRVDPEFIIKVQDAIGYDEECQCWEGTPSMEMVEAVLIAAAGIQLKVEE